MENPGSDTELIAERYRRFAEHEARGSSPLYQDLSHHVAGSPGLLAFLAQFPSALQQPNLFLAAVRHVAGTPRDPADLDAMMVRHAEDVARTMRVRRTQTNEPGRCASLLPLLAALPGPLALLEVGASAGLCLLPDLYGYDYGGLTIDAPERTRAVAPVLRCQASAETPLPRRPPQVVWRAGLDINPLAVESTSDMAWLETLVWPEQVGRLERLRAAVEVARLVSPGVRSGDLRRDLTALAATAPADARLVIFHTAVLGYVEAQSERDAFAATTAELGATWISSEWPDVFPQTAAKLVGPAPAGLFLMSVDGVPVAWTAPHGQVLVWI